MIDFKSSWSRRGLALKQLLLFAAAFLPAIADARADRLACPLPPKVEWTEPLKEGTWEKQYDGWLEQIQISKIFDEQGKATVFVRCIRSTGSVKIRLSKACRFIAGKGAVKLADSSKRSEIQVCKMPTMLSGHFRYENDESCLVECD